HYVKSDGEARPKVFRWKSLTLAAGATVELGKTLTIRHASIRRLYPGAHRVDLQVNGAVLAESGFELRFD
ncbi:MAG: DNA alkylation repair protein, partial [Myxococcota bacterium]